jgi:hypothetical protein
MGYDIPDYLRKETREWLEKVFFEFDFEVHKKPLLIQAGETLDRIKNAREIISKDGAFYTDATGKPRKHPALDAERNDRIVFARLIRELNLTDEAPDTRPPTLKYLNK